MASRGTRPIRIANCSGAIVDPGWQMLRQATLGPVDVITGDYLAEANLASDAESFRSGKHPGYAPTAKDGIMQTLHVLNEKRIKVIVNGGALNPKGLAEEVLAKIESERYDLTVAWVEGDDLLDRLPDLESELEHLDAGNPRVQVTANTASFLTDRSKKVVSANAYLGARAIRIALEEGADIVICGRVSDASPVIGAAQWWHGWSDTDFDQLAGALIAGHLIECSAYVTGANFAGFDRFPVERFVDIPFGIVEVHEDGTHVVTKHDNTNGLVSSDTVKCQLLYELQGNIYLHSDVKADIANILVEDVGNNRVRVSGIRGYPPPPTTKLAIFYNDGFQCEFSLNATAYSWERKFVQYEAQLKQRLQHHGVLDHFDTLEFQRIGNPEYNPRSQLRGTVYLRVFAQAQKAQTLGILALSFTECFMQHYHGMHGSLDLRTIAPKGFQAYMPATIPQSRLDERAHVLGESPRTLPAGHPSATEALAPRENHETASPVPLTSFGPTTTRPLGDMALGRSGDKGANMNIGLFVSNAEEWGWLRSFLTCAKMKELMGEDWSDTYFLERVEFPNIWAVHFVVYGSLGRGVSSSSRLDCLGKGFADFIRARTVDVPVRFVS